MENTTFKFDPMTTAWEFGYWTKGWSEPDDAKHQHWEASDEFKPWSINRALDRAIELGFLDASDREMVRLTCLNDGEYFFGSDETSGWMIGVSDLFYGLPAHPNDPIWMLVEVTNNTYLCDSILDGYEVLELKKENRIIRIDQTLTEILNAVLPEGENNSKYLDICLQSIYAASSIDSYVFNLESGQRLQISRKEDNYEDIDDEDIDYEICSSEQ
jgi:hypothetical protein